MWPMVDWWGWEELFQVVVERLSTLLDVELRPPENPQRWRDRDLSSWVDWKAVEVAAVCLGMVPVGLCLTGLLAAMGGPGGLDCLVLVPAGMTAAACDPCGCPVAGGVALGGDGGLAASAASSALPI